MSERRLLVAHFFTCIHHRKTPTCTAMHKQELPKAERAQSAPQTDYPDKMTIINLLSSLNRPRLQRLPHCR